MLSMRKSTRFSRLYSCCEPLAHIVPVHHIPNGLHVIRSHILVLQVVGMLPHIYSKQRNKPYKQQQQHEQQDFFFSSQLLQHPTLYFSAITVQYILQPGKNHKPITNNEFKIKCRFHGIWKINSKLNKCTIRRSLWTCNPNIISRLLIDVGDGGGEEFKRGQILYRNEMFPTEITIL